MSEINSSKGETVPNIIDFPSSGRGKSFLVAETTKMERTRRLAEQDGERRLASVKARERAEDDVKSPAPEGELQNDILEHPDLMMQCWDGADPNESSLPSNNPHAKMKMENAKRDQEKDKQNRLQYSLGMEHAPKFNPRPGR